MVKIAITGNIAAGKSEVEKILIAQGFDVYDTDIFTHKILASSSKIKNTFNKYDILENGEISRKKLGRLVFNNIKLKQKLENLIHPEIREIIKNIQSEKPVFISVPLLYEAQMEDLFDYTIFVSADENIRLERLIKRNNFPREEALLRIKVQQKESEKISKSDFVILNNGNLEILEKNVKEILARLKIPY